MNKTAVITGIGGQDGFYLSRYLLSKGYEVIGVLRRTSTPNDSRIKDLYCKDFYTEQGDLTDPFSIQTIINKYKPDFFYNLGAMSFVKSSFNQPHLTFSVNTVGVLNCLEAIREFSPHTRFYQATSSEIFGSAIDPDGLQRESTNPKPCSPYGTSKLAAHSLVKVYRESYGLFCVSGILFNHESPQRGFEFVTRKISRYVSSLYLKQQRFKLNLGNLNAFRDFGYAGDYVKAMYLMMQQEKPDDYVVATGETYTVRDFLEEAFFVGGFDDYEPYIHIDPSLYRPSEVNILRGDSSKIRKLGWEPEVKFKQLVRLMVENDIRELSNESKVSI